MSQKPIEVYYWPTPNGHKITIMLEECGLPYEIKPVNIGKGDQFKPEFLAISPNNRMPAIIDPDGPGGRPISVFESGAILQYLGRKTGKFYPDRRAPARPGRRVALLADGQPRPQRRQCASLPQLRAGEDRVRHQPLHQRGEPALRRAEHPPHRSPVSGRRVLDRRHGDLSLGAPLQEPGPGHRRVSRTSRNGSSACATGRRSPRRSRSARTCALPPTIWPPTRKRRRSCSGSARARPELGDLSAEARAGGKVALAWSMPIRVAWLVIGASASKVRPKRAFHRDRNAPAWNAPMRDSLPCRASRMRRSLLRDLRDLIRHLTC